jgi:4-hydroxy-2-oxoheptanedioate aldolase
MEPRKSLKERLACEPLLGLQVTHPNPPLAEMAAMCGYDFLMLDEEHGVFSQQDYLQTLQAISATDTLSIVRLAGHDGAAVGRYMDMGVDAIMAPGVANAGQVQALVRAMQYPPAGTRGFGASLHRGTRYGLTIAEHVAAPRKGVALIAIIESTAGVANIDEILAVDGLDGVLIGPSDLSASIGRPRDFSNETYKQAIARVERAVAGSDKFLGGAPHADNQLDVLLGRGYRLLLLDADMCLIREAMSAQVKKARSAL